MNNPKFLQLFTVVLVTGCISLNAYAVTDTIKKFVVDDLPVTDKMFGRDIHTNGREMKSGSIRSYDKVWFTNDSLGETLVYELYTDDFRMEIFLFLNNNIPKGLIKRMELHTAEGQLADDKLKATCFKGFIRLSRKINPKFFITDKGLKLGSIKEDVIKVYGAPGKTSKAGKVEMLEWAFPGDILYNGKSSLKGKRLAKDSFGHQATMFFQDDVLIGLILHNDIP
jgi:hypothetical protein